MPKYKTNRSYSLEEIDSFPANLQDYVMTRLQERRQQAVDTMLGFNKPVMVAGNPLGSTCLNTATSAYGFDSVHPGNASFLSPDVYRSKGFDVVNNSDRSIGDIVQIKMPDTPSGRHAMMVTSNKPNTYSWSTGGRTERDIKKNKRWNVPIARTYRFVGVPGEVDSYIDEFNPHAERISLANPNVSIGKHNLNLRRNW